MLDKYFIEWKEFASALQEQGLDLPEPACLVV
jgi:hypothetical protein